MGHYDSCYDDVPYVPPREAYDDIKELKSEIMLLKQLFDKQNDIIKTILENNKIEALLPVKNLSSSKSI